MAECWDLLTDKKHNIKKTWQIMKNVMNKNRVKQIQAKFKLSDGSITSDKYLISEQFNDFFVNIGPKLAKKIPSQNLSPLKYMGEPLVTSMSWVLSPLMRFIKLSAHWKMEQQGIMSHLYWF